MRSVSSIVALESGGLAYGRTKKGSAVETRDEEAMRADVSVLSF